MKEGFCTTWKDGPTNCYRLVTSTIAEGKWAVMKGATTVASWSEAAAGRLAFRQALQPTDSRIDPACSPESGLFGSQA